MGGDQQHSYSLKVFIVFVALGLPFPQVHLSVVCVCVCVCVCVWGGGGGGGGQQALADTSCGISTGLASIIYIMNLDFGDLNVAALTPPITHNTMIHTNPLLL